MNTSEWREGRNSEGGCNYYNLSPVEQGKNGETCEVSSFSGATYQITRKGDGAWTCSCGNPFGGKDDECSHLKEFWKRERDSIDYEAFQEILKTRGLYESAFYALFREVVVNRIEACKYKLRERAFRISMKAFFLLGCSRPDEWAYSLAIRSVGIAMTRMAEQDFAERKGHRTPGPYSKREDLKMAPLSASSYDATEALEAAREVLGISRNDENESWGERTAWAIAHAAASFVIARALKPSDVSVKEAIRKVLEILNEG